MSSIVIKDLEPNNSFLDTVSNMEKMGIVGGREVYYVDLDGDQIADVKVIERNNGNIVIKQL